MRPLGIVVLVGIASGLTGCILPPAFSIASLVADGVSVASTGKTVTDHAISLLAHEDCRLWRALQFKPVCQSETTVVATAKLPPPLPMHAASPALTPNPNPVVAGFVVDEPRVGIAIPFPAPKVVAASGALTPETVPTHVAPPPKVQLSAAPPSPQPSSAPPSPPPSFTASFVLDEPNAAIPVSLTELAKVAAAPKGPSAGDAGKPVARAKPVAQQASAPNQPAPATATTPAHSGQVRAEMIIRSGTNEADARALAESLSAVGATVRPVRHGDATLYEVVMGLSG